MDFTKKKIKSNYLNKEFEVSCWEMKQGGRSLTIVEHAAFEDIILNKVKVEGFNYDLLPIIGAAGYPVMECVMKDASGRKIVALGEAHPETLVNKISRQNPVIMAGNRAFDRAAIRYLALEGKVYSSEEIPDEENDNNVVSEVSADNENEVVVEAEETEAVVEETTVEDVVEEAPTDSSVGTTVVNFGKYRGKNKTVAEIWETDESWANYAVTMDISNCGETTKKQIEALKRYKGV